MLSYLLLFLEAKLEHSRRASSLSWTTAGDSAQRCSPTHGVEGTRAPQSVTAQHSSASTLTMTDGVTVCTLVYPRDGREDYKGMLVGTHGSRDGIYTPGSMPDTLCASLLLSSNSRTHLCASLLLSSNSRQHSAQRCSSVRTAGNTLRRGAPSC